MKSPKGKYRMTGLIIIGLVFLSIVALSGGFDPNGNWYLNKAINPNGWVFKQLINISEVCGGLVLMYFGHRIINHKRTHELLKDSNKQQQIIVTSVWILAIAYVVGNGIR